MQHRTSIPDVWSIWSYWSYASIKESTESILGCMVKNHFDQPGTLIPVLISLLQKAAISGWFCGVFHDMFMAEQSMELPQKHIKTKVHPQDPIKLYHQGMVLLSRLFPGDPPKLQWWKKTAATTWETPAVRCVSGSPSYRSVRACSHRGHPEGKMVGDPWSGLSIGRL